MSRIFITFAALTVACGAQAATVEAVSFHNSNYGLTVVGGSPAGIVSRSVDYDPGGDRNTSIDDPAAVLAIDTSDIQIGCVGCDPDVPYTADIRRRTNRPDPTEFAEARVTQISRLAQDQGPDVINMSIGDQSVNRTGLAQARITSDPVNAQAIATSRAARTNLYENITNDPISFFINGFYDIEMYARVGGADALARASSGFSVLFSGHSDGNLSFFPQGVLDSALEETGSGATAGQGFASPDTGFDGVNFTAFATADGQGPYTEARVDVEHAFRFMLTVDPGQTVAMRYGFSQTNAAQIIPPAPPAVPLPAAAWMLLGALGGLAALRRLS